MNKIMVFGDAFLDSYLFGEASRISPEAPVPVLRAAKRETRLGGAANVAVNAVALGAEVLAVFAIADDASGRELRTKLSDAGVRLGQCVDLPGRETIVKERVVAGQQQIVRIDYHDSVDLANGDEHMLESAIDEALETTDVAVISDYGKGSCTEHLCAHLIDRASKVGIPVIVDPKGRDWRKYWGATIITPNLKEINAYSGLEIANDDKAIERAYSSSPGKLGIANVLLTRSERGMSLIDDGGIVSIEARKHEVFDVSGAGDTVVAALACELSADLSNVYHAMSIANLAAGVAVGKRGTSVVSRDELERELAGNISIAEEKIYGIGDRERLRSTLERWRNRGLRIVATSGCFDIVHKGHMHLFARAAELGDRLVVLMNSDESVKRLKGPFRPVNSEGDRAFVLASLVNVDAVVVFDPKADAVLLDEEDLAGFDKDQRRIAEESPIGIVKMIHPDAYAKGGDYKRIQVPEAIFADSFEALAFLEGYSTTGIVEKCQ